MGETKSTANKLGGFSFEWKPVIQEPKVAEVSSTKNKTEESKPSPFANFTFGKSLETSKPSGFNFGATAAASKTSGNFLVLIAFIHVIIYIV